MSVNNAISINDWDKSYDNLKILEHGNRNFQTGASSDFDTRIVSGWGSYPYKPFWVPSNTPICTSVYYKAPETRISVQLVFFLEGGGTYESKAQGYIEPTEEGYIYNFTTSPEQPIKHVNLQIRTDNKYTSSKLITFRDVKVEIGRVPTPWTPAPEDIGANPFVADIAEASYKNKANRKEIAQLKSAITALGGNV